MVQRELRLKKAQGGAHRGFEASPEVSDRSQDRHKQNRIPDLGTPLQRAVHLRRMGHCQQLGWFGNSKISPTSAKDTQTVGTGVPLATHWAWG